jgi:mono/diheme cytochrome c family protein
MPGKEAAKTNCAGCHTADLGKASGNTNCYKCHNPTATHTLVKAGKNHKPGAASTNSKDPKCVNCHGTNGLAACTPCHA